MSTFQNETGETVLHKICEIFYMMPEIIEKILTMKNTDVNALDNKSKTPLHKLITENGKFRREREKNSNGYYDDWKLRSQNLEYMRSLKDFISADADLDLKDSDGRYSFNYCS